MLTLRSFRLIINLQTLVILAISLAATYTCRVLGITAEFPMTLVGVAVVFPLVFSINSAYKRRETALGHYGSLKGNGRAIFYAAIHWIENPNEEKVAELKQVFKRLFGAMNSYLHTDTVDRTEGEREVLTGFKELSESIKGFRAQGMSGSEVSRTNQYLSKMMIDFEQLKHIHQYRTPLTLRAYSKVFISVLPIVYGPYFAYVTLENGVLMSFVLPTLFSIILVSLDNIQEHLENPFDRIGEDDIFINSEKFVAGLGS